MFKLNRLPDIVGAGAVGFGEKRLVVELLGKSDALDSVEGGRSVGLEKIDEVCGEEVDTGAEEVV